MSEPRTHSHAHATGPLPIVCAWRRELRLGDVDAQSGDELELAVRRFLTNLPSSLKKQGCRLIGHVKGMVEAGEAGSLWFSLTSFDAAPSLEVELHEPVRQCSLTVNAIVFGGEERALCETVLEVARAHLHPWRLAP